MTDTDRDDQPIAIIGSGGIGGFLAGELVKTGHPTTLCVRTPFRRLTIESEGVPREVPVAIAPDPAEVTPARWVFLTVKAQDTAATAPWLAALARPDTTVVVVQNGIGHVERVRPIAGSADIVPAIIYCSVERTAPGRVVHHGGTRLVVPRAVGSAEIARLFAPTVFDLVEDGDFKTVAWRKLMSNLVGNPVTALTLRRAVVLGEEPIRALGRRILEEALAVGRAEGARLTGEDVERVLAGLGSLGPQGGSSMLYDRLAGRPLEHDYLTGALVAAAERHAIEVPVNRTLLALLAGASGHAPDASD